MERMNPSLRYVTLNQNSINSYCSPLIEALKKGQGLGRISTLEAMSFLYQELDQNYKKKIIHDKNNSSGKKKENKYITSSNRLIENLQLLTKQIDIQLKERVLSFRKPRYYTQWVEHVRTVASTDVIVRQVQEALPTGLRFCSICT